MSHRCSSGKFQLIGGGAELLFEVDSTVSYLRDESALTDISYPEKDLHLSYFLLIVTNSSFPHDCAFRSARKRFRRGRNKDHFLVNPTE